MELLVNLARTLLATIVIVALLGVKTAHAETSSHCRILMSVNDARSSVYVDNQLMTKQVGSQPFAIACKAQRQQVKVVSSDRQEFIRVMPSVDEYAGTSSRSGKWNVSFRAIGGGSLGVAGVNQVNVDRDQAAVLRELASLRTMVQTLLAMNNSGQPVAHRGIASVGASRNGYFVQILSMPTHRAGYLNLDRSDKKVIEHSKRTGSPLRLEKCVWTKDSSLTRVLLGPLSTQAKADEYARAVGRDSFVVLDPNCGH